MDCGEPDAGQVTSLSYRRYDANPVIYLRNRLKLRDNLVDSIIFYKLSDYFKNVNLIAENHWRKSYETRRLQYQTVR